jgi:uncharacterized Fe-S cluster protein YjdI/CDGSH-type Zn-finger protein
VEEGERKNPSVAREYRTDQIVVFWEPEYCMHTGRCLTGLPQVFDVRQRPWVHIDAASADEVARVVASCPTGALSFARLDDGPQEQLPAETEVTPWPNGPLFLVGHIQVTDTTGSLIRETTRVALCRCGGSKKKPFCDGTHRENGFRAP